MLALKGSSAEKAGAPKAAGYERTVEDLLDAATSRGERWMSLCRILFTVVTFVRFVALGELWDGERVPPKAFFVLAAGSFTIALSLWLIRRTLHGPISTWVLATSVTLDMCMCFAALLSNALWPSSFYAGIFALPDGTAILLIIIAAGFRLSPRVVWLAAGLGILSASTLVTLDYSKFGSSIRYGPWALAMMAIFGAACTVLAMLVARQTRSLVVAGARESVRAYRAHNAVTTMLQDHHDVHSLLSSANLNAELLLRGLGDEHSQRKVAEYLREDLRTISDLVLTLRERAFHELTSAQKSLSADLPKAVRAVTSLVSRRFPDVQITVHVAEDLRVHVAGGAMVLERVLLNLLINACEGDGAHGAASIWIDAHDDGEWVYVAIADDGPGFPDTALRTPTPYMTTSKREGGGLGLFLVQNVVSASGGRWSLGRRSGGGACVEVIFPKCGDTPAPRGGNGASFPVGHPHGPD